MLYQVFAWGLVEKNNRVEIKPEVSGQPGEVHSTTLGFLVF